MFHNRVKISNFSYSPYRTVRCASRSSFFLLSKNDRVRYSTATVKENVRSLYCIFDEITCEKLIMIFPSSKLLKISFQIYVMWLTNEHPLQKRPFIKSTLFKDDSLLRVFVSTLLEEFFFEFFKKHPFKGDSSFTGDCLFSK